jgi:polyribonucleotide nucleotidyltransferase
VIWILRLRKHITSFQKDIKIDRIPEEIIQVVLTQVKEIRMYILNIMYVKITVPWKYISDFAPLIKTM